MCMELVRSVATFHRAAYCTVGAVQCWWLGGTPSGQRGRPLLCWGAGGRPGQWRSFGGSSRPDQTTGHRPRHRCAAARRPARQWTAALKEGCRKPVLGVCACRTLRASLSGTFLQGGCGKPVPGVCACRTLQATGLRHPSFGGRCRKAMLGVCACRSLSPVSALGIGGFVGVFPNRCGESGPRKRVRL